MEWVDALHGTVVGLDTAPLIYFIEENPKYLPHLRAFFDAVDNGHVRIVTSALTLTEVLIHPLRQGRIDLADKYRRILLHADHVETVPVSAAIAEEAARLRAKHVSSDYLPGGSVYDRCTINENSRRFPRF